MLFLQVVLIVTMTAPITVFNTIVGGQIWRV